MFDSLRFHGTAIPALGSAQGVTEEIFRRLSADLDPEGGGP
jgi:hypothetical protein